MENIKDSSDTNGGQKRGEKRKAEEAADNTQSDLAQTMFSKKIKETSARTIMTRRDAMEMAAASYRGSRQHLHGSVTDMAQATPNEKVKQTNADTSTPTAAIQGGAESDYRISLYNALIAYERSGKQSAAAYLLGYIDRGIITVLVSTNSTASDRTTWDLARQEYDRFAASLVDRMGIKNDTIVGWAHSNAKAALQLCLPTQPDNVRRAMAQLKGYAPV
ncbi:hypothetical protein LTR15_001192 [Elasticomyces elasticus]|nr:hypothetical protein LTR15_001192 [Elasticomyces elasticus]